MRDYILRRLLWAIPTLWGAVTIIFLLMNVLPGDIAMTILGSEGGAASPEQLEHLREQLGLNRPLYVQYFSWLAGLVRGDLGTSLWTGQPVSYEIGIRLPYTMSLVVYSLLISIVVAIPVGVFSAIKQDSALDYGLRSFAILGLSIPNFWFGMLLLLFVVGVFRWFPPLEYATIYEQPLVAMQQLTLPAIALGWRAAAGSARMMRSSMLEVLREDYVRTARSKGLTERIVIYLHALKNGLLPVITMFGMEVTFLFAGTVIIETVFRVPGIGSLLLNAITRRDIIMVEGTVLTLAAFVLVVNLIVDLVYGWVDPRIRYE